VSALRDAWGRWRHDGRRRRALAALASLAQPRRILVVCHGNACRSPYAAAVLARALHHRGVVVASAGLVPGSAPEVVHAEAARRGVRLGAHRPRLVTHADVVAADLIVVMDERQREALRDWFGAWWRRVVLLGDFDPDAASDRAIADPVAGSAAEVSDCYSRIDRCVATLAGTFGPTFVRATPA